MGYRSRSVIVLIDHMRNAACVQKNLRFLNEFSPWLACAVSFSLLCWCIVHTASALTMNYYWQGSIQVSELITMQSS